MLTVLNFFFYREQYEITDTDEHVDDIFSSNFDDILNNSSQGFVHSDIDTIPGLAPSVVSKTMNEDDVGSPLIFNNLSLGGQHIEPNTSYANYRNTRGSNDHHSDSSDDYAGDSDDCSL